MSKRRRRKGNIKNAGPDKTGRPAYRKDRKPASGKKNEDLMIMFTFFIILSAIIGGYYYYDSNYGNNGNNDDNMVDLDDSIDNDDKTSDNNNGDDSNTNTADFKRTVLIEAFTSVECYWCNIEEEPALQEIADDYTREQVVIVAYHGYYGEDPYETEKVTQRGNYYGGISGTPNVWFDGILNKVGGTGQGVDAMYNIFEDDIKQRAALPSGLTIEISGTISSSQILVKADLANTGNIDTGQYSVRIAVTEDGLQANGKIYDWVMRDIAEQSLAGKSYPTQLQQAFDVDPLWDVNELSIVAWIQDDRNGEVSAADHLGL